MSTFWSVWIIVLTLGTIVGCAWLLFANRKGSQDATTGHAHDGIEEYDNPLPAWWLWMFVITLVFGIGYLLAFPGLGNFGGLLGWTQEQRWEREVAKAEERYGEIFARYGAMPVEELVQSREAMNMGRRLFANNCAQCHGADALGSFGFPNLTDDAWLYGGSPEAIKTSIVQGRQGVMPGWRDQLGEDGVAEVTHYTLSLSGAEHDAQLAADGKQHYQTYCVACHGPEGKGNQALGAPNLSDDVWLYGGSAQMISQTIAAGRNGNMPAHGNLLSDNKIQLLTAYVYSLSQGQ